VKIISVEGWGETWLQSSKELMNERKGESVDNSSSWEGEF